MLIIKAIRLTCPVSLVNGNTLLVLEKDSGFEIDEHWDERDAVVKLGKGLMGAGMARALIESRKAEATSSETVKGGK